ncbi:hypothetical protein V5O48_010593 [Marasmius crinis-equi]|uniref:CxC2-like cysteine cluster KDZ transposase-associated domain-containing protein n=1 Tax=Marasmius crinis-equi TaxID=585013 RepID=A0ABR3F7W7_9AGAR
MNWADFEQTAGSEILVEAPLERRRRYISSDNPFLELKEQAGTFLKELIRLDGRGSGTTACGGCGTAEGVAFRCRSCADGLHYCQSCIVDRHWERPTDRVEFWNGSYFERKPLKTLGMFIQLGHSPRQPCRCFQQAREGFVLVEIDYIQEVSVRFCTCQRREVVGEFYQQLLRRSLFPATISNPHTAFTFRTLRHFHTLTLTSKVMMYDFYNAAERSTDGSGLLGAKPKVSPEIKERYDEFVRVMRIWRYIKLLKRGGVMPSESLDLTTPSAGQLAVRCPACPRPGINLIPDWERLARVSPDIAFMFYKFISVDACFRLKQRAVSTEQRDPGLFTGKAYFVEQGPYQALMEEMKRRPEQEEEGHCLGNTLSVIAQANTKFSKGYAQTGCMLCLCARHEIMEPNGLVDLNKGERYWHTDYAILASQRHSHPGLMRVLSYDICCQYHKKFFARLEDDMPESVKLPLDKDLWRFVVPKLHIQGHGKPCQERFALHFLPGAGQTDGEGIERRWASLGPIATSSKEMAPGHRRETIDDHMGASNWMKLVGLGALLRKRRAEARLQIQAQGEFFQEFSECQASNVQEWSELVSRWEESGMDPEVETPIRGLQKRLISHAVDDEHDVRLRYVVEEDQDLWIAHDLTPSAFILLGLEIEDQQRHLQLDLKDNNFDTTLQQTSVAERRGKILRQIAKFRASQRVYTPQVSAVIAQLPYPDPNDPPTPAERTTLYMPSELSSELRSLPEMSVWVSMGTEFRRTQLKSSLDAIRTHLFVQTRLHSERSLHIHHQKANTRARHTLERNRRKITENTLKYQHGWAALRNLVGKDFVGYQELKDGDVVSYSDPEFKAKRNVRRVKRRRDDAEPVIRGGESSRLVSWIWMGVDTSENSEAMKDALRVEWCKAQVRCRRWTEELVLLEEEMRRTLLSLEHEAGEWDKQVHVAADERGSDIMEGMQANCIRQAAIRRGLSAKFQALWALPDPVPKPRKRASAPVDLDEAGEDAFGSESEED